MKWLHLIPSKKVNFEEFSLRSCERRVLTFTCFHRDSASIYPSRVLVTEASTHPTPSNSSTPPIFPSFYNPHWSPTCTSSLRCCLWNSPATSLSTFWESGQMPEAEELTLLEVFATIYHPPKLLATFLKTLSMPSFTLFLCLDPAPFSPKPGLTFLDHLPRM